MRQGRAGHEENKQYSSTSKYVMIGKTGRVHIPGKDDNEATADQNSKKDNRRDREKITLPSSGAHRDDNTRLFFSES